MKKVFTLLLMSIITSIGVWAQEVATASANFKVSDDRKTLTVSGKGDLTNLETTITTTKFTNAAVGNVFVQNGESYASVVEGAEFSATGTYYKEVPGEKTQIENTAEKPFLENNTYVSSKSVIASWNEAKLNEKPLYLCQKNNAGNDNGFTWINSADKVNAEDAYKADDVFYVYAIKSTSDKYDLKKWGENNNHEYYLEVKGNNLEAYLNKTTTFTAAQTIYVSTDEGNSFTRIESGATATYNAKAQYYTVASSTYVSYSKDLAEGQTVKELFATKSYIEDVESDSKAFLDLLNAKIIEGATESGGNITGSYEKVVFVNEDSSTPLIINDAIVHAILFPKYKWGETQGYVKNMSIVTLDLGQATIMDLTSATFKSSDKGMGNMTNLTLPLTKLTSVYSESVEANVDKMVVPANVLGGYENYTPDGGQANLVTVTIPEGYDRLADNAFNGNNKITTFNLPSTLKLIGNSAFENCVALASITLNDGLENIGKRAFVSTGLTDIKFPSSLRIINDAAFANLRIEDLKFNAGLKFIGNSAFALPSEMTVKTIEIPASVRFIGPFAFNFRQYQDVFFLGAEAPIMPMGKSVYNNSTEGTAFPANTLMGNNGFYNGQGNVPSAEKMYDDAYNYGYANRENYKNHEYYFCILHFPTGLTDEQRAKYTDITRVYKTGRNADGSFTYDASGGYDVGQEEKDGQTFGACTAYKKVAYGYEDTYLGKQYIWPSQSQWNRSYVVNSLGYNWNGKDKYLPDLSDEDLKVLAYAGYKLETKDHPNTEEGYYTLEELQKIAHMGTRQFVLTNADTKKDEKPEEEPEYPVSVKGSNWWTICLPFNMTKAQVDEVFGIGTHVCRFSSVSRTDDGKGNKNITLRFQNDVYATKWTRDAETLAYTKQSGSPADEDIVIYSHEAYMIYPTNSEEDAIKLVRKDYTFDPGSPLPTIIKANANDNSVGADHTEYRFVGNYVTQVSVDTETSADKGVAPAAYETVTIPQYSYIYAKKKNETAYKFWFFTGTQMAWSPNKCVVQATARDGGANDYNNFFGGDANTSKVKQVSLFGEDGTVTEIENVTIIAGEGENAQIVYNLNGQVVSSNGNTDRLAKGVYIKGGKKFMVK